MIFSDYFNDVIRLALCELSNQTPRRHVNRRDRMYFASPLAGQRPHFVSLHDRDGNAFSAPRPVCEFRIVDSTAYSETTSFVQQPDAFDVSEIRMWDAKVGGNLLFSFPLTHHAPPGQPIIFPPGRLSITFN